MSVNSNGSGKCSVHGSNGSFYRCNKCGDTRCWSCLMKLGGSPNKPCVICGNK